MILLTIPKSPSPSFSNNLSLCLGKSNRWATPSSGGPSGNFIGVNRPGVKCCSRLSPCNKRFLLGKCVLWNCFRYRNGAVRMSTFLVTRITNVYVGAEYDEVDVIYDLFGLLLFPKVSHVVKNIWTFDVKYF